MRILHVATSATRGGAARAAYRIHRALVEAGVASRMRVLIGAGDDATVTEGRPRSLGRWVADRLQRRVIAQRQRGWQTDNPVVHTFGQVSAGLVDALNASDADLLHLHWIAGMLSVRDIGRLRKPIVWTLHDMWAFSGGEHYGPDDPSARFRLGYRPTNRPAGERGPDLNRRTWEAKRAAWADQAFTIVAPSAWLAACARASVLLGRHPVQVVPYPIDMDEVWRPVPRATARAALGLPIGPRLILMGADSGMRDPRKGGDLLRAALARVIAQTAGTDVRLVVFGPVDPTEREGWPCPVHWLGTVRDDRALALTYAAADLVVVPSRQDNLPNTAIEAHACGTPVVAFAIGGLPDIIVHRSTGWLAPPFHVEDLAAGIEWLLTDDDRLARAAEAARAQALRRFAPADIAARYQAIYAAVRGDRP